MPPFQFEDGEPTAWLEGEVTDGLELGAGWLTGVLVELGVLAAPGMLLREELDIEAALEVELDEKLGGGLGGAGGGALGAGVLGVLLVDECCAKVRDENNRTTATTRLERRISTPCNLSLETHGL